MSLDRRIPIEERLNSNAWDVDQRPHIRIIDPERCRRCDKKPCLYLCPARCYTPALMEQYYSRTKAVLSAVHAV